MFSFSLLKISTVSSSRCRESLSRKERTHRLIVRGAILEQYFPELKELSEPEISEVFQYIVKDELHQVLKEAIAYVRKQVLG